MKIIIADDEPKICKLITKLVDWKSMDMEIVAIAHDGIEALSAINEHKPDIVITDIRMPGYDGLELIHRGQECSPETEFVIISGYRQFEYAKNAIRYGVKNYLLKPIKTNELLDTLEKIKNNYTKKHTTISNEEKFQLLMENNRTEKRQSFLREILSENASSASGFSIEAINESYFYQFQKGSFQTAVIKIDGLDCSITMETDYIYGKIKDFVTGKLKEICYDSACMPDSSFFYILMNYQDNSAKEVRSTLKRFLSSLLCQKEVLHNINITMGLGSVQKSIEAVPLSLKTARLAVEQRLILGTNILLDESHLAQSSEGTAIFHEFNKRFSTAIDRLNEREIADSFSYLKQQFQEARNISGHDILQFAKELAQLYFVAMQRNNFTISNKEQFLSQLYKTLDSQNSWQNILSLLYKTISASFKASCNTQKQEANKPIREARNYIKTNLKSNLSLEQISAVAGFNASYFSSLFKKETGSTISEYIIQVRMERAKELLKETDWNISVICEEVGYNDLKNFNKNFKKYTGLRPNEFRKIYS